MALNDWMSAYQNTKLGDLHLPGSHDAGTIDQHVEFSGKGTQKNSVTQDLTISEQLNAGTRFFDLRLKEHGGQVVAHHTTAGHGAYGTDSLGNQIGMAREFCGNNRTEIVIFRISHTKTSTDADQLVKDNGGDQLSRCTGNLCNRTLEDIRTIGRSFEHGTGGLVCIFNEGAKKRKLRKADQSGNFGAGGANVINQWGGIHSFKKFKGEANAHGIATCGCYTGTNALRKVIRNALTGQYEHTEKHSPGDNTHLWQVYWQKTYVNPWHKRGIEHGTTGRAPGTQDEPRLEASALKHRHGPEGAPKDVRLHGSTHAATGHLIHLMEGHAGVHDEDYRVKKGGLFKRKKMTSTVAARATLLPNILSYDFVNPTVNQMIINLNDPGGIAEMDDE